MKPIYYYFYFYDFLLLIIAVVALVNFKKYDQALKVFCGLIVITTIAELTALYFSHFYHYNAPVYAIFDIVQMALTCIYFNYSIDYFYKYKLGYHFAAFSIVIGILNIIYLEPINTFSSYYMIYECLGCISMSLFSFFRLLLHHEQLRIKYYVHFWIPVCLVFLWSVTFFYWTLHEYFNEIGKQNLQLMAFIITTINIITYSSIGFLFYYYPKMKEKC